MQFQNFYSALSSEENFFPRLQELEIYLYDGCLSHDTFKELFELYSVKYFLTLKKASIHYESQGLLYEFNFYIQKMQNLLKNEKIKPLLKRRKSRDLAEHISQNINEKKQKIEKIKKLLKENKKETNSKQLAIDILKNFKESETNQSDILKRELDHQVENFKKKLDFKKKQKDLGYARNRVCSLPHTRLYNMIKQSTEEAENLEKCNLKRKVTVIKRTTTPARRKSILSMSTFKEEDSEKSDLESEKQEETKHFKIDESDDSSQADLKLNKIISQNCSLRIDQDLAEILERAEQSMKEEIKILETEIERFLDDLAEEKVKGTLEINSRYEIELKYDVNSVQTIIYNQIKSDKEKEINEFYKLIDDKKKVKLGEIRASSDKIRTKFYEEKSKEIGNIKSKISEEIKSKIVNSFYSASNLDNHIIRTYSNTVSRKNVERIPNNFNIEDYKNLTKNL